MLTLQIHTGVQFALALDINCSISRNVSIVENKVKVLIKVNDVQVRISTTDFSLKHVLPYTCFSQAVYKVLGVRREAIWHEGFPLIYRKMRMGIAVLSRIYFCHVQLP